MIQERDKLLKKSNECNDPSLKQNLLTKFKLIRNEITKIKRKAKSDYYKNYFEKNMNKTKSIWKYIKSIIKLNFPTESEQ